MYNTYKESWKIGWLLKSSLVEWFSSKKEASNGDLYKVALIRGFFGIKKKKPDCSDSFHCILAIL